MHGFALVFASLLAANGPQGRSIRIEAESGQRFGVTVSTSRPGFSGSGYVTGFTREGDRVVVQFRAPAGIYEAFVGFSSPNGPKGYDLGVNGHKTSGMFLFTGNSWSKVDAGKVELQAGENTAEVDKGWGYFDVDFIEFVPTVVSRNLVKPPLKPVDPDASRPAQLLLARLGSTYGKETLSGQYNDEDTRYIEDTAMVTPAIYGADFMDYSPSRIAYNPAPKDLTERAIAHARSGQIVTMSWHWNAPTDLIDKKFKDAQGHDVDASWYKGFYTQATTFDLASAIDHPDSPKYKLLLRDIDAIAVQLKKFADAQVPILWRPLHEAEGGWFWWGAKGPAPFVKLWRLMFDRLTKVHHLHNLIWVFTVGDNPAWYPGDAYVDVVGVDAYPSDHSDALSGTWDRLKAQFNGRKLMAISEFGGVPDIPRMQRFGVEWAYFVSWPGQIRPPGTDPATLTRIYRDRSVVNCPMHSTGTEPHEIH